MESARGRVRATAEFSTGVEFGHHEFEARESRFALGINGDATTIVLHLNGAVRAQDDGDLRAVARQCLIDGVVDDFPQAVHQTAGVRGPDVHAGAFTHGVKPLKHREVPGGVVLTLRSHEQRLPTPCDTGRLPHRGSSRVNCERPASPDFRLKE